MTSAEALERIAPDLMWLWESSASRFANEWVRTGGDSRSRRVAALLDLMESEIATKRERGKVSVPCRAGCNACCSSHQIVVSQDEVLVLLEFIARQERAWRESIRTRIANGEVVATSQQGGSPCIFLTPQGCSVYPARPSLCRAYFSMSLDACLRYSADPSAAPPVRLAFPIVFVYALRDAAGVGKQPHYELNSIMSRLFGGQVNLGAWMNQLPREEADLVIDIKSLSLGHRRNGGCQRNG